METIGFPLVIKGCADGLSHKTESGLVQTDVRGRQEAEAIFDRFMTQMTEEKKAVLVQEMIRGRRELAAGLIRDSQFGPCVMFGLGGIFAEILKDTAFRVAPLEATDGLAMMAEIRGLRILGPVRVCPRPTGTSWLKFSFRWAASAWRTRLLPRSISTRSSSMATADPWPQMLWSFWEINSYRRSFF